MADNRQNRDASAAGRGPAVISDPFRPRADFAFIG
jgi:hypothetical protein